MEDPWAVAEVLDELNSRRVEALQTSDYRSAQKLKNAAMSARAEFRQRDRDILHREVLEKLDGRHREAVEEFKAAKSEWKRQHQQMVHGHQQELRDMDQKRDEEHRALEQDWLLPEVIRRFNRRSVALLQNRQMEQCMMLCGMYDQAHEMKQINARTEKAELQSRKDEMSGHFEIARANLVRRQQKHVDKLRTQQEDEIKTLAEKERRDMTAKTKRVEATERILAEEKDFENFVTKKYKKPSSWILPPTVMTSKGPSMDLPVISKRKPAPPKGEERVESDQATERPKRQFVTRLPLPPLAIRHYKPPSLLSKPRSRSSNI
jgi:hypothetical protein